MSAAARQLKKPIADAISVKQLPLGKLGRIAGQLAATDDAQKAAQLKKQFLGGYYGKPVNQLEA